MVGLAG